jgi:5-methylcytosine-specific restriction endonuclease McrA
MAKREPTPEEKEEKRARDREWYKRRDPEEKVARAELVRDRVLNATPEEKAARAKYIREYAAKNREKLREQSRAKYLANQEAMKAKTRAWVLANPEQSAAKIRECKLKNRPAYLAGMRDYRLANIDKAKATDRAKYLKNSEKVKERARKWVGRNPERRAEILRNDLARRRRASGVHTAADVARLYEAQRGVCVGCGCALIAKGKGKYHVDHIMPIALGGSNWPENLQLLCPTCNMTKQKKHPDEWRASAAASPHKRQGDMFGDVSEPEPAS